LRRPTIADIAIAAGVSKGAVSYALNGKPGVSVETRKRILELAEELGWRPNTAARALSQGRSGAIGLVVDRPARVLGVEPFFMQLISGIETALAGQSVELLLQVTEDQTTEMETYRRWWAEQRVDGVILVDLRDSDPRVALLDELGFPTVVVGHPRAGTTPCVWCDDTAGMHEVMAYLAALGHQRIARIAGPDELDHTRRRSVAFEQAAHQLGVRRTHTVHADYSGEDGARAARRLLSIKEPPTAMVFDNDIMAVASLGVAQEMGVSVPDQLSIVAGDDSVLCELVRPALTTLDRDVPGHGAKAVEVLLARIAGQQVGHVRAATPVLVPRGSTARVEYSR
jgi:DNA-binding LacI/PurR family transcriptional regulator